MFRKPGYCYLCDKNYDKPHECGLKVGDIRCSKCFRLEADCKCVEDLKKMKDDNLSDTQQQSVGKCDCRSSVGIFDSSNKNLGQTEKGYVVNNMYAKQIWNEAIEAAANCAEINIDDCKIHDEIRKLKK